MTVLYVLILFLAGGIAGFGAGFMGIGGGAILTPVCLVVFPLLGVDGADLVKIIFGTNMFLVTMFSIVSVHHHHRNGRVSRGMVLALGPAAILGSVLGSWAASAADPFVLIKAFGTLLIVSSAMIVLRGSPKPSGGREESAPLPRAFLPLLGFVAGFLGSFLGIGGGIVMVPVLILLFAVPVSMVAGTSSSAMVFIGITGTLSYIWFGHAAHLALPGWSSGYVWWSAAIPLMCGGIPFSSFGAWVNARTHTKILRRIFGAVLFVLALRILLT
jgi:uncharacterized protein